MTILRHAPWLLAGALGLVVLREAVPGAALPSPPSIAAPMPWTEGPVPLAGRRPQAMADALARVLARPLFAPGRRPPPAGRAAGPPRLAGTLIGPDGMRVAILDLPGRDRPLVLREGASGSGIAVLAVSPGHVLALLARDRVVLTLHDAGLARDLAAPAAVLEMTKDPRLRGPNNQDE